MGGHLSMIIVSQLPSATYCNRRISIVWSLSITNHNSQVATPWTPEQNLIIAGCDVTFFVFLCWCPVNVRQRSSLVKSLPHFDH
jgi:hypothetical protein